MESLKRPMAADRNLAQLVPLQRLLQACDIPDSTEKFPVQFSNLKGFLKVLASR
jgi:hypothetical protein